MVSETASVSIYADALITACQVTNLEFGKETKFSQKRATVVWREGAVTEQALSTEPLLHDTAQVQRVSESVVYCIVVLYSIC